MGTFHVSRMRTQQSPHLGVLSVDHPWVHPQHPPIDFNKRFVASTPAIRGQWRRLVGMATPFLGT